MEERYIKIRFTSKHHGNTAGLVIPESTYERSSLEKLSRLFPTSEGLKMKRIERSRAFETWTEAFLYQFPEKTTFTF